MTSEKSFMARGVVDAKQATIRVIAPIFEGSLIHNEENGSRFDNALRGCYR
jgi:hypothetical protein